MSQQPRTAWYAAAGAAALGFGVAVGAVVAAFIDPAANPLVAVGGLIVDLSPRPLKEFAVTAFGTADKQVAIISVLVVSLALGALAGVLGKRSRWAAEAVAAGLAIVLLIIVATSRISISFIPTLATWVTGSLALWWLIGVVNSAKTTDGESASSMSRRNLIVSVAGTSAAAVVLGGVSLSQTTAAGDTAGPITLPTPKQPLPPTPQGFTDPGFQPFVTPQKDLYRIDIAFTPRTATYKQWRLVIDGMVDHQIELSWDDLMKFDVIERDAMLMCVSNPVGGPYQGAGRWLGVRTGDLLAAAAPESDADMVLSLGADGFTVSTPLPALTDDREALLAFGFNGEPLTAAHGSPVRMVTPGMYGYVGATKWLTKMTVTRFDKEEAFWTPRGWSDRAPVKLGSRIDTQKDGDKVAPGQVTVGGTAWASRVAVKAVEVRTDSGPWQQTTLGPDAGLDYWRQWKYTWDAAPGSHLLECRVIDANGAVQSEAQVDVAPNGAEGYHQVKVNVG